VLISEKEFSQLMKRAVLKRQLEKTFSVEEARAYSKRLIRQWAKEG
jgi:hypothetical protein